MHYSRPWKTLFPQRIYRFASNYKSANAPQRRQINPIAKMKRNFPLTSEEESLFATLRRVVDDLGIGSTVRVAGGWVRDKLLYSAAKDDIDIVIDNFTGSQFCEHLNQWIRSNGGQRLTVGVIQQNPDKSKHLETATANIGRLSVDFVNLRSETYTTDSRIPTMSFGSPREDALRRDLTVNALFYNIHSDEVEDFTGFGLSDLQSRLIRTPLEPRTTLLDDPLRVLRAIRFAVRLNFSFSPDLLGALVDKTVNDALVSKVSRERLLAELEGILAGKSIQCGRGYFLLHQLNLTPLILAVPEQVSTLGGSVVSDVSAFIQSLSLRGTAMGLLSESLKALSEAGTSLLTNPLGPKVCEMILSGPDPGKVWISRYLSSSLFSSSS